MESTHAQVFLSFIMLLQVLLIGSSGTKFNEILFKTHQFTISISNMFGIIGSFCVSLNVSPVWRQAIIWTNAAVLSIRPQGTYFSEISFKNQKFSFKEMLLKMSSAKWQPFFLSLNVLKKNLPIKNSPCHDGSSPGDIKIVKSSAIVILTGSP